MKRYKKHVLNLLSFHLKMKKIKYISKEYFIKSY